MDLTACPDDADLLTWLRGESAGAISIHMETCAACRQRHDRLRAELACLRRVADNVATRSQQTLSAGAGPTMTPSNDSPTAPPTAPATIGKYVVAGLLGEGGQALVYRAVHPGLRKELVLKVSKHRVSRDRSDRDRLVQEARLLAGLDHPNLARVYDVDFWEDRPFIVMEYVRGRTLAEWLRQERPSPRQSAALIAQLARALATTHRAGIAHLDLKPGNILIDEAGLPRILDFGLARICQPQVGDAPSLAFGGTPYYMAPEQARGDPDRIGPSSDLFALGAVLYEMLTGRAPFHAPTSQQALNCARHCEFDRSALRRARVDRALERICLRALAEDPADRPARAEDLAAELERYVDRPHRRRRLILAGVAFLGLLIVAGSWLMCRPAEFPTGPQFVIARVQRGEWSYDLPAAMPLRSGDQLRINCPLPHGFRPRVFTCDVDGKWEEYTVFTLKPESRFDRLQADVRWPGKKAGTRVILICAGRTRPPRELPLKPGPWESLPPNVFLWMTRDAVTVESAKRQPLQPAQQTSLGRVEDRLEQLRLSLLGSCEYFVAVAYPHTGEVAGPKN